MLNQKEWDHKALQQLSRKKEKKEAVPVGIPVKGWVPLLSLDSAFLVIELFLQWVLLTFMIEKYYI